MYFLQDVPRILAALQASRSEPLALSLISVLWNLSNSCTLCFSLGEVDYAAKCRRQMRKSSILYLLSDLLQVGGHIQLEALGVAYNFALDRSTPTMFFVRF